MIEAGLVTAGELEQLAQEMEAVALDETIMVEHACKVQVWAWKET